MPTRDDVEQVGDLLEVMHDNAEAYFAELASRASITIPQPDRDFNRRYTLEGEVIVCGTAVAGLVRHAPMCGVKDLERHQHTIRQMIELLDLRSQGPVGRERGHSVSEARVLFFEGFQETNRLLRFVIPSEAPDDPAAVPLPRPHKDTAFIIMAMDPKDPMLDDVNNAIKDTFKAFGIRAERADDIEHSDVITGVILDRIKGAEFIFCDLTHERPNVYYELGYAHAVGKRPILFRRTGERLHFDISVHNCPEYKNATELKEKLRKRLEAMTGKTAPS